VGLEIHRHFNGGIESTTRIAFTSDDDGWLTYFSASWMNFENVIATDHDGMVDLTDSNISKISLGAGDDFVVSSFEDDVIATGEGADTVFVHRDTIESGRGHDVIDDFDAYFDTFYVLVDESDAYSDPFADLTQTDAGALLSYADDSSVLFRGVDVGDLSEDQLQVYVLEPLVISF